MQTPCLSHPLKAPPHGSRVVDSQQTGRPAYRSTFQKINSKFRLLAVRTTENRRNCFLPHNEVPSRVRWFRHPSALRVLSPRDSAQSCASSPKNAGVRWRRVLVDCAPTGSLSRVRGPSGFEPRLRSRLNGRVYWLREGSPRSDATEVRSPKSSTRSMETVFGRERGPLSPR